MSGATGTAGEVSNEPARLDVRLMEQHGHSRAYAAECIKGGFVTVDGKVLTKPGAKVTKGSVVTCTRETMPFVSRGGVKLLAAIERFHLSVGGLVCLDVGTSTGGFTDCLLQNGAKKVYAVDTGVDQLAEALRNDQRVVSMEKTNVTALKKQDFIDEIDFVSVDVSFVSSTKIMQNVFGLCKPAAKAVWLIKPQFEAGRKNLGKTGVVKDKRVQLQTLCDVYDYAYAIGFAPLAVIPSPISGGDGNKEFLFCFDFSTTEPKEKSEFMSECKEAVYL